MKNETNEQTKKKKKKKKGKAVMNRKRISMHKAFHYKKSPSF